VVTGARSNTIRVFAKPLQPGLRFGDYLAVVPRDRPDSALP
jgi:hypothetical protein